MARTAGQKVILAALMALVGFGIFFLHAQTGASEDKNVDQVRMAVDPTVLPVVLPDGSETPAGTVAATDQEANGTASVNDAVATMDRAADPVPADDAAVEPAAPATGEPAPAPEQAKDAPDTADEPKIVKSIAMSVHDAAFTLTIATNAPVGDTSYMNLANPRRLVLDLREKWALRAKNVIRASDGPVKYVVVGEHPDRLRLVVHFRQPPAGKLQPEFERKGHSVVISVPLQ